MKNIKQYHILLVGIIIHLLSIPIFHLDPLYGDATQFNDEANNIISGIGWINTEGPGMATTTYPTQVVFIILCKYIFGNIYVSIAVILQHIFVLITAIIVYYLALLLTNSKRVGLLSEFIVVTFPHMIYSANILSSHVIGMMLSVLGIYLLIREHKRHVVFLCIGMVWAVASMARFTYQFFVPFYVLFSVIMYFKQKNRTSTSYLIKAALFVIGFVLVMLPWWIHVQKNQAGSYGYSGAWRICYAFNRSPEQRGNNRDENEQEWADIGLSRREMDSLYQCKTMENIRHNPEWIVNNILTNTSMMMINVSTEEQPHQPHISVYVGMYYSILIGFALIGVISMNKNQLKLYILPLLFLATVYFVHVPIYGYISNSFPIWALYIPVSAASIVSSIEYAVERRKR